MMCSFNLLIFLSLSLLILINSSQQRFEAIDPESFHKYTDFWRQSHRRWINIDPNEQYCDPSHYKTMFPICEDNLLQMEPFENSGNENNCPKARCLPILDDHVITPFDTIDYLPPALKTSLDNQTICQLDFLDQSITNKTLGLDDGMPPDFIPITPTKLTIEGKVYGMYNGKLENIPNAEILVWQINPLALNKFNVTAKFYEQLSQRNEVSPDNRAPYTTPSFTKTLRDLSCSVQQHTTSTGSFLFDTLLPPSYGPPRHLMFKISAEGYKTLTTRVYFDKDWRLQQLTTLNGVEESGPIDSFDIQIGFSTDKDSSMRIFPGVIASDPRVAKLEFREYSTTQHLEGLVKGMFYSNYDFVLSPVRKSDSNDVSNMTVIDIDGIWADIDGSLLKIESHGNIFVASEYPHARNWGTVTGYLLGNTIRGVNFFQKGTPQTIQLSEALLTTSMISYQLGHTIGTIIPSDPFSSSPFELKAPQSMRIEWNGGNYEQSWTKQDYTLNKGYRFVQLYITRVSGENLKTGQININEIQYFEGVLAEKELPSRANKMKTPRNPNPQVVTCSTFLDQINHCYRAFDGNSNSSSSWITKPVGSKRNVLAQPQWITFDFGEGRGIRPTAIKIFCDAAASMTLQNFACPMTFSVRVSNDNIKFETIYKADLYDYNHDYSADGKTFYFLYETSRGRSKGQVCPSCELGPYFSCNLDAYDGGCDSRYCDALGRCQEPNPCEPGRYMSLSHTSFHGPSYQCILCPSGRYGSTQNLRSQFCSGECEEGYYCPEGSTNSTMYRCGDISVYCPKGSPRPFPAPAGRKTLHSNTSEYSISDSSTQSFVKLCEEGNYCTGGKEIPCPVGRFGNATGLQTSECNGICAPGFYCPLGTISQIICPPGYYCPDGRVKVICPNSTWGGQEGLRTAECSGLCSPGYYCLEGSITPESIPCPAGRYGFSGSKNSNCTDSCPEGYFCPEGTSNPYENECGEIDLFCPLGSSFPTKLTRGYYTILGNETARSAQTLAEPGYFAFEGERRACPEGTYGEKYGLSADDFQIPIPDILPTFSPSITPSLVPSFHPTISPSVSPSLSPSQSPTLSPSHSPTLSPSSSPISASPTLSPVSHSPTFSPSSKIPTLSPSISPTISPSRSPTLAPFISKSPSQHPTSQPTSSPSSDLDSSFSPTVSPTMVFEYLRKVYQCSGLCEPGYYCLKNSTSSRQFPCPAGRFGNTSGLTNSYCTSDCLLGHYCPEASDNPIPCPPGVFGNVTGLTDKTCSPVCQKDLGCDPVYSLCEEGYYCPEGSISARQYECGGPDKYCPLGSSTPLNVSLGHYTIGHNQSNWNTRHDQIVCEKGNFCVNGLKSPCPAGRYGDRDGLSNRNCSGICPLGHYCPEGTIAPTSFRCPSGRYGSVQGLESSSCSGLCSAGYYCKEASSDPLQYQCGIIKKEVVDYSTWLNTVNGEIVPSSSLLSNPYLNSFVTIKQKDNHLPVIYYLLEEPDRVYCPTGSSMPLIALDGYYTIGYNRTTRFDQLPCEPGSYCVNGIRQSCPAGTYGNVPLLSSPGCSGLCYKGYYCLTGSTLARQFPCPIGRYGAQEGLTSASCSGPCPYPLECPEGSTTPNPRAVA